LLHARNYVRPVYFFSEANMISSRPGEATPAGNTVSRAIDVVARGLRRALAQASSSLTLQEGLYRAYTVHLCDLTYFDDVPSDLRAALHSVLAELRCGLGFDETGEKVRASKLEHEQATALLARLEALTLQAEALAAGRTARAQ
jgi:hypothetical protein